MTGTQRLHNYLEHYGGRERLVKSDTWNKQRTEKTEEARSWVKDLVKEKAEGRNGNMTSLFSERNTWRQTTVIYSLLTQSIVLCDTLVPYTASGPLMLCTAAILVNSRLLGVTHSWAHSVGEIRPQHELFIRLGCEFTRAVYARVSSNDGIKAAFSYSYSPVDTNLLLMRVKRQK